MAIIATGSKTIIDLSDGKSLSVYLGANQPRTQIRDVNAGVFQPDWTQPAGQLVVTPVIYANQTAIPLSSSVLSLTWKRKEGIGSEAVLGSGETVSGNVLTVSENKLAGVSSGQLTYIVYVAYTDPDTGMTINAMADITFALITTGENAKSAWIAGEQVFKYDTENNVTPAQITVAAHLQNVTMDRWQYKNSEGEWEDYPTTGDNATISASELVVKPDHAIWNGSTASLRILTSDNNVSDTTSIYKVQDGAAGSQGEGAPMVFLTSEMAVYSGSIPYLSGSKTTRVVAYIGTTKVTPTVGTATSGYSGLTISKSTASNNEVPLTMNANSSAHITANSGTISIPVTYPVNTTLRWTWVRVSNGTAGSSAVNFQVYSPDGTVFVNGKGSLTLQTVAYSGSSKLSIGTCQWARYESGEWINIGGATGATLTVNGSDVVGTGSYRCTFTYSGNQYVDTITLIDKTDNYQAEVDSTAGDVFKNAVGNTCLICRLWQAGVEVDRLKCTTYAQSAPSSPEEGAYYYKINPSTPSTALMRYDGSEWVDVTADETYGHERTYYWYRRDRHGNPLDNGGVFAMGKVIYVDDEDVDVKTVFVCEVVG